MIEDQIQTPGPQLSTPPGMEPAPKKNKTLLTCGIIAVVLLCIGVIIAVLAFGGLTLFSGGQANVDVNVTTSGPVSMGQPFDLKVSLTNAGSKAATVTGVKLSSQLLSLAAVTGVNPTSSPQDESDGKTYAFDLVLEPGASRDVVFTLKPIKTGSVTADVTALMGSQSKFTTMTLAVAEAPAAQTGTEPEAPVTEGQQVTTTSGVPFESVVEIQAYVDYEGELVQAWWGSGTIVSPDGIILTNAHVVSDTKNFAVKDLVIAMTVSPDQPPEQRYHAKIMQLDSYMDIAVLQIETDLTRQPVDKAALNLPAVKFGNSDDLQLNDELVILGYPGIGGTTITLTDGRVGGFTAEEPYGNRAFIKTSATFAGGNSGGLAVNSKGEMVGIPTQLGYGGVDQYADCRRLVDTNGDGMVDEYDSCIPTGGFINALRPINLALSYVDAAKAGQVNVELGQAVEQAYEATGEVYYEDDFEDKSTGWPTEFDSTGGYAYIDGEYQITVTVPNQVMWVSFNEDFEDTESTIDARPVKSSEDGSFGILCRYQDKDNFYGLEVSEDGYYSIWRRQNNEYIFLTYWEYSELIPLHEPMTITGSCIGDTLTLAVNGLKLAETTDSSFQGGDLGFFASTYENGNLVAGFDNYSVRKK